MNVFSWSVVSLSLNNKILKDKSTKYFMLKNKLYLYKHIIETLYNNKSNLSIQILYLS